MTRLTIHCNRVIVEPRFASAVAHRRAVDYWQTCNSCAECACINTNQILASWGSLTWDIASSTEWVASHANFITRILILILIAYCSTFAIFTANRTLGLAHLLCASRFHHLRYLINAHSMLEYSKLLKNKAAIREKTHRIVRSNFKIIVSISTICR